MALKVREQLYQCRTNIQTTELLRTSRLLTYLTGLDVQVNKAITGENAFSHSSGIHQDGLLKDKRVYEIMSPEEVGADSMELILTARSGRHAFKHAVEQMGFDSGDADEQEQLFKKFLDLADTKKEVYDHDIYYLLTEHREHAANPKQLYELMSFQVMTNDLCPTAALTLRKGDQILKGSAVGDGPIDALYSVIKTLTVPDVSLKHYKMNSISRGTDAVGRVNIQIEYGGKAYYGRAMDTDIIKASAQAFLNGINAALLDAESHAGAVSN